MDPNQSSLHRKSLKKFNSLNISEFFFAEKTRRTRVRREYRGFPIKLGMTGHWK